MAEDRKKLIFLDDNGLNIATKEEIKNYLKELISSAYGEDINFNAVYPEGIFVEGLAQGFRDSFEAIQGVYNSFNIRNSSGVMLDTMANIINIHRKSSTQAVIGITLSVNRTASDKVLLPTGIVIRDEHNNIWRNRSKYTQKASSGSTKEDIVLTLTCDSYGEVSIPSTLVILSPSNIQEATVTYNSGSLIQGSFAENDIDLRHRITTTPSYNSVSVKEQLIKKLLENKYVKSVKVYSNDTSSDIPMKIKNTSNNSASLPPTQLAVIVQYNSELLLEDYPEQSQSDNYVDKNPAKNEIASIIAEYKGISTITFEGEDEIDPSLIYEYIYEDSQDTDIVHDIYFIEAQEKLNVEITIDISKGQNYNSETTKEYVKELVSNYLGSLKVGEDLSMGGITSFLYENSNRQFLIDRISSSTDMTSYDEYFPTDYSTGNLTINVNDEEE